MMHLLTRAIYGCSVGITIIIKKNGKVGTRRFGVPLWEAMVDDIAAASAVEAGLDVRKL